MTVPGTHSSNGIGRKIFLSLFFGVFLAVGLGFTGAMARSFWAGATTHGWSPVECTVVESGVLRASDHDKTPKLSVRYRYRYEGRDYSSTQLSRGMTSKESNAADVYQLSQQLAPGRRTTCYVDPAQPEEAVLFRGSLWQGMLVLFPLIFVAVGGGGVFFIWRSRPLASPAISSAPISSGATTPRGTRLAVGLFFSVFLLFGLGFSYFFGFKPLFRVLTARHWSSVPCTVVSSRVASHSGSDDTTYSVEVVYRYEIDGRNYTSARYKFMSGSSSGHAGKAEIVAHLPPGTKTVCFVNPRDPTEAVLERGFTADLWFGLIPLVFALIGAGGLRFIAFGGSRPPGAFTAAASRREPVTPDTAETTLSAELRPVHTRVAKLLGFIFIALFWNGIVSVFVGGFIHDWNRGQHHWFVALFLTPFVAIGLFLLGAVLRQALALSNPRPRLRVNPRAVSPGKTFEVAWEMEGKAQALRRLHLFLEGREEATYRRGTSTATDKHVFATLEIVDTTDLGTMRSGTARLTIPAGTMHSWASANNRIVWMLRVRGEIPRWADVDEEFPFTVLPHPSS